MTDMTNHLAILQRENVREFMKEKNLSNKQLAEVAGVAAQTIRNNFGSGRTPPSPKTINKIEMAYDMPTGFLSKKKGTKTMEESQPVTVHTPTTIQKATISMVADDGSFNIQMQVDKATAKKMILEVIGG